MPPRVNHRPSLRISQVRKARERNGAQEVQRGSDGRPLPQVRLCSHEARCQRRDRQSGRWRGSTCRHRRHSRPGSLDDQVRRLRNQVPARLTSLARTRCRQRLSALPLAVEAAGGCPACGEIGEMAHGLVRSDLAGGNIAVVKHAAGHRTAKSKAFPIGHGARSALTVVGVGSWLAGGAAAFLSRNGAGAAALVAAGTVCVVLALMSRWTSRHGQGRSGCYR